MLFTHHFFYCSFFPLLTLTYCCCRAVRSELHISNTQFFYVIKNLLLLLTWPWVKCDNYFSQELENAQLKKNLRDKKKHCCFIQTMIVLYIYRAFFLKSSKCISSVFSKFRSNSEQTKVIKQTNQNTFTICRVWCTGCRCICMNKIVPPRCPPWPFCFCCPCTNCVWSLVCKMVWFACSFKALASLVSMLCFDLQNIFNCGCAFQLAY